MVPEEVSYARECERTDDDYAAKIHDRYNSVADAIVSGLTEFSKDLADGVAIEEKYRVTVARPSECCHLTCDNVAKHRLGTNAYDEIFSCRDHLDELRSDSDTFCEEIAVK